MSKERGLIVSSQKIKKNTACLGKTIHPSPSLPRCPSSASHVVGAQLVYLYKREEGGRGGGALVKLELLI